MATEVVKYIAAFEHHRFKLIRAVGSLTAKQFRVKDCDRVAGFDYVFGIVFDRKSIRLHDTLESAFAHLRFEADRKRQRYLKDAQSITSMLDWLHEKEKAPQ